MFHFYYLNYYFYYYYMFFSYTTVGFRNSCLTFFFFFCNNQFYCMYKIRRLYLLGILRYEYNSLNDHIEDADCCIRNYYYLFL